MFYVKAKINDDIEIKVALYNDAIFCTCPKCGCEVSVDEEILANILNDGDLASSGVYCDDCALEIDVTRGSNP